MVDGGTGCPGRILRANTARQSLHVFKTSGAPPRPNRPHGGPILRTIKNDIFQAINHFVFLIDHKF